MKYTIMGFSQKKLIEFGMDLQDALLLRYFVDFKGSKEMIREIHEEKEYYWVQYDYIKNYIPIISIQSNDVLRRRFKKMVDCGVLIHYHKKQGGRFSFYALGDKYIELIMDDATQKSDDATQKSEPYDSKVGRDTTQKSEQKINLINNNSYKDIYPSSNEDITHIVEYLNLKANTQYKHTNKKTVTLIKARFNEKYTIDDFKKVIDIKTTTWLNNPEFSRYLRPETLFSNKFENYLNEYNLHYKQEEEKETKEGLTPEEIEMLKTLNKTLI